MDVMLIPMALNLLFHCRQIFSVLCILILVRVSMHGDAFHFGPTQTCIPSAYDLPDHDDWVSQLPNEVLMLIMSHFTMKEAARTSLVSHNWKKMWHYFPILTFEDPKAMHRIAYPVLPKKIKRCSLRKRKTEKQNHDEIVYQERSSFVSRVNHVVEQHLGATIDEFRVIFDLDKSYQSQIDEWLVFAFSKQVKRLELHFKPFDSEHDWYSLPLHFCRPQKLQNNLASFKPALTSLCLKYVNVTAEVVEGFLHSFPFLEKLSIKETSYLKRITGLSLSLKHLEIDLCWKMEIIDISAPKLLSFQYQGRPIELHIRNASSLSKVSVGTFQSGSIITYAFDSLSRYFSQLEYLSLQMNLYDEENLRIDVPPALMNLKHLELWVSASFYESLLGWTPLLEAAPGLQKLTLKLNDHSHRYHRKIKHEKRPLKCLKTLEIVGIVGCSFEEEFVTYVFENAIMLELVIIDINHTISLKQQKHLLQDALKHAKKLEDKLPPGVKLVVRQP